MTEKFCVLSENFGSDSIFVRTQQSVRRNRGVCTSSQNSFDPVRFCKFTQGNWKAYPAALPSVLPRASRCKWNYQYRADRCSFVAAWIIDFAPPCEISPAGAAYGNIEEFAYSASWNVTARDDVTNKPLRLLYFSCSSSGHRLAALIPDNSGYWWWRWWRHRFGERYGGDDGLRWHINTHTHTLVLVSPYLLHLFRGCSQILCILWLNPVLFDIYALSFSIISWINFVSTFELLTMFDFSLTHTAYYAAKRTKIHSRFIAHYLIREFSRRAVAITPLFPRKLLRPYPGSLYWPPLAKLSHGSAFTCWNVCGPVRKLHRHERSPRVKFRKCRLLLALLC